MLLTALSILALFSSTAIADGRIGGDNTFPGSSFAGGISESGLGGLAVSDKEGGDIYLADGGSNQRVDQFESDGTFVRAFGWGIVPGAVAGTGDVTAGSSLISNVNTTLGAFATGAGGGKIITGAGIPPNTAIQFVNATEIGLTKPATASGSGVALNVAPGPGNIPTNEQQKLTVTATAGEYKLAFRSPKPGPATDTTAAIDYNASAGEVREALEDLGNIGAGNVSVSGSNPYVITFQGRYADTNVFQLEPREVNLSGGSPSSEATVSTPIEGGGVVETCTTTCSFPAYPENAQESGNGFVGSRPGQFFNLDEIAVDNDSSSSSYGDVYVVDPNNFRIQKFSPEGELLLMFGGEVDKTTGANVCTKADLEAGDTCGAGVPGTGPSHFYREEPGTVAGGFKSWSNAASNSVAVGPDGTVYVGDYGRIQEFEPDGTFTGEFTLPDGEPQFVAAVALDSAGNLYERSVVYGGEHELKSQAPGVREYSTSHALVRTFDTESGSEPTHITLDASGDLFVSDQNGGDFQFRAFKPDGTLYAVFTSDQVAAQFSREPLGIALGDAAGHVYATSVRPDGAHVAVMPIPTTGPPVVTEEHVTDVQPTTATLHAAVNPRGFDTHYHFQYVDQGSFETEGGFSSINTQTTASNDLGLVNRNDAVQASVSGLNPETVYHYRAVADSECEPIANPGHICVANGPAAEFTTLQPASLRELTTQTVGPELVTLKAELNPNGSETHYVIHFGLDINYLGGSKEGTLPIGNEFEPVQATFSGLKPNTTYHYQLIATNSNGPAGHGEVVSADQTFTTEHSAAEERASESCPNTNLREENNSLALPDCRAYEQTTEVNKEGNEAFPRTSLSPGGTRVLYGSTGEFAGATVSEGIIQYLAQRTSSGWVTTPVIGRPGPVTTEPTTEAGNLMFSPEMDRWLFYEVPDSLNHLSSFFDTFSGYLSMGMANGTALSDYTLEASPLFHTVGTDPPRQIYQLLNDDIGRRGGLSNDLSHLFAVQKGRLLPAPEDERPDEVDGLDSSESTRVYEFAGLGGPNPTIKLAAEVPLSLNPVQGCAISSDSNGSIFPAPSRKISSDGSVFFYTGPIEETANAPCGEGKPNPIALFAHIGTGSIQLNLPIAPGCEAPAPCALAGPATPAFGGASPDGKRAWFTTTQPLVSGDTDSTRDLYMAEISGGHLADVVEASAGEVTPSHPTPGEGAKVDHLVRVSPDGSHVAFVAAGVLTSEPNSSGEAATAGAENLYVYDADTNEVKFVMSGGAEIRFTPDGRFMVLTTGQQLTGDDVDNVTDAYRFECSNGQIVRLSFGRNGNDGNGNDNQYAVEVGQDDSGLIAANGLAETAGRAMSADGSTVIFSTEAPLVSHDTNEAPDVYQWEEDGHGTCHETQGCVSLVSDGVDPHAALDGIISSSGQDITFFTLRNEVPGDTDGVGDIYDARVNGGFHAAHPPSPCGSPEACLPQASAAPGPPALGSESFVGSGNAKRHLQCAKGKVRVKRHGQVRCVAKRHKKGSHKKSHHKSKHKRANNGRGGAK